jgi:hypothetical protein
MNRVHAIAQRPIPDAQFVAVVIGESDVDQRHIGIMHRAEGAKPRVLHLAWHCHLRNEACPPYFTCWIDPPVLPERLRNFAALCRRVWRKNQQGGIPYAFSNPDGAFDLNTSAFLIGPTRFGLTCATFVLELFNHAGLSLAILDTWPAERPGDREWQQAIIVKLEGRATSAHIEHLRSEIGAARYRPEEVGAAASIAPPATEFDTIKELSESIISQLRSGS